MNMDSRSWLPPSPNNGYNTKGAKSSSNKDHRIPPTDSSTDFSAEISRMPGNPPKSVGPRRTHSDVLTLLDGICFDNELGVLGGLDELSALDETEEELLPEYLVSSSGAEEDSSHLGRRLLHSQSMDVVSSTETDNPSSAMADKSISAANLAELAITDPKRAKRIWANRQSAARSKERKMRYIAELQSKARNLQSEKASLSMQFALLQGDTAGVASENIELKLQLQSLEQQVHLQDALNDALKEEIQHLKVLTGQAMPNGQPLMNSPAPYGANQNYHSSNHAVNAQPMQYQFRQHQLEQFQPRQLLLH